jgi:phage shock protein A
MMAKTPPTTGFSELLAEKSKLAEQAQQVRKIASEFVERMEALQREYGDLLDEKKKRVLKYYNAVESGNAGAVSTALNSITEVNEQIEANKEQRRRHRTAAKDIEAQHEPIRIKLNELYQIAQKTQEIVVKAVAEVTQENCNFLGIIRQVAKAKVAAEYDELRDEQERMQKENV